MQNSEIVELLNKIVRESDKFAVSRIDDYFITRNNLGIVNFNRR